MLKVPHLLKVDHILVTGHWDAAEHAAHYNWGRMVDDPSAWASFSCAGDVKQEPPSPLPQPDISFPSIHPRNFNDFGWRWPSEKCQEWIIPNIWSTCVWKNTFHLVSPLLIYLGLLGWIVYKQMARNVQMEKQWKTQKTALKPKWSDREDPLRRRGLRGGFAEVLPPTLG